MEAVRLSFPFDVTKLIHEYASDRVGVHPTAQIWDDEVNRFISESDLSSRVVWTKFDESGRVGTNTFVFWEAD